LTDLPEVRTSLPLPICHAGYVFMAYAEAPGEPAYFCECTRSAITQYLSSELEEKAVRARQGRPRPQGRYDFVIDHSFPKAVRDSLWAEQPDNANIGGRIRYRDAICHRCHRAVPPFENMESRSYFDDVFRRLIYRDLHELGFSFIAHPLPHVETPWQVQLLPANFSELVAEARQLSASLHGSAAPHPRAGAEDWREYKQRHKRWAELERAIDAARQQVRDFAVARLRSHYEFPEFKAWLQRETVLFLNLRSIFRGQKVVRHAKPEFLGGLELDIWIPAERIGVEFQGAQHYRAFDYLGGEKALAAVQDRDRRKAELCARQGVMLACFGENDDLNEHRVVERLAALRRKLN